MRLSVCASVLALTLNGTPAIAQNLPTGYVSLFGDYFPEQDASELRGRVFVEQKLEPAAGIRVTASGFAEGLVGRDTAGIVRVHDANVEWLGKKADVLVGYTRVTWGKLDEIQPTDVVNPLDVSRFFFEGRGEARIPVLLLRGRFHPSENVSIEGVYVPDFRPGRFDRLAEGSSPFNIAATTTAGEVVCLAIGCPTLPPTVVERQPPFTGKNAQGGGRVSMTTGRVDWSVSAYRGYEAFGLYRLDRPSPAAAPVSPTILVEYPRFTMLGGDFEAVRGKWGFRGEVAAFVDDNFQSPDLRIVRGRSFDAGAGVDRRAGDYTLSATVLVHSESYDAPLAVDDDRDDRHDLSLVASLDRTFSRERYRFRGFGVFNTTEGSAFVRGIGMANLRDNFALEASIGWFAGDGRDLVGRFGDSDFVYLRVKYYF
jgi:hypothetical protein